MPVEINFPRDSTLKETNRILRSLAPLAVQLDGTPEGYKRVMRRWFIDNGALEADENALTELCKKWYTVTRVPWHGWTVFAQPDVTAVTTGTRGGDNVGLSCTPSTDTVAGQDDYAGHPLFAVVDCNFTVDGESGEPKITAIDGITDNFQRYSPDHFVGVLQMSGYEYQQEYEREYRIGYSSLRSVNVKEIEPLDEAIMFNGGGVRPFVVHAKYLNHTVGGKLTSYAGVIPTAYNISHNSMQELAKATGTGYSGTTTADDAFLKLMMVIKYASLTLDGILQGCCVNKYQFAAAESESGVRRVILTAEQAANFEVGMGVLIGDCTSSTDRGDAGMYSATGQKGAIITAIEPKGENVAIYVDTANTFETTESTTYISTFHWPNGSCDGVLGNDGSPKNCTSGKYPAKLQGIEYMPGGYEVICDAILKYYQDGDSTYWAEPYVCRDSAKQATSITEDYKPSGVRYKQPSAASWCYIRKLALKKGVYMPVDIEGGGSSTYTCDAWYTLANDSSSANEILLRCYLDHGVGVSGLFGGCGDDGLGVVWWGVVGRLSPNGKRGEWAA